MGHVQTKQKPSVNSKEDDRERRGTGKRLYITERETEKYEGEMISHWEKRYGQNNTLIYDKRERERER